MNDQNICTSIDKRGVATVTLNRPEKHNAFNSAIIQQLTDIFEKLATNSAVRIVILASTGRSFSAGADLAWMQSMANYSQQENLLDAKALAQLLKVLNNLPKPTIARVQGAAFGGAVGLLSCCDLAVASPRASFSLSEVKIGLIPATISPYVIAAIGQRAARRYFLTAERFNADTAQQLGLISQVVGKSVAEKNDDKNNHDLESNEEIQALNTVIDGWIDALLANSPQAITAAKQLVFDIAEKEITDHLIENTSVRIANIRTSEEGQEGLQAFLQKRKPRWALNNS